MTGEAAAQDDRETTAPRRLPCAWTGAGYAFFAIGLVRVALPVLPTTIFWIIAAACFPNSCTAIARKITAHPRVGPDADPFRPPALLPPKSKNANTTVKK